MIASTQYTDLTGTAAADISDLTTRNNSLQELATHFNIDQTRYKVVGISVYSFDIFDFICVDIEKSIPEKEHIVKISIEDPEGIFSLLFKRFHIVVYERHNEEKYKDLNIDEEIEYAPEI